MLAILLHLLPTSAYALLAAYYWRVQNTGAALDSRPATTRNVRLVLLTAIIVQGLALHEDMFQGSQMRFGFSTALAMMSWLAIAVYWIESLYARLEGLQALGLPLAAVCALLPLMFPAPLLTVDAGSAAFRAHFIVAMLAYSLFTLAALHALLMAAAEKRLHRGRMSRALASLPPLLTMESLLFRLISVAFLLLTATLVSGVLFSEVLFGKAVTVSHKTVFAFVSWAIFAALLFGRHVWGWRGRKALRWTLAGFLALLLAYVGSRFVVEVLLGRG
ncbi:MAG: cytochrome c biogenesis protein CcsA [Rhodocyclaceae bacterium]|nr:cytochrome c biogenesis protein CcsA [Rhodocyclaceae bacterium]